MLSQLLALFGKLFHPIIKYLSPAWSKIFEFLGPRIQKWWHGREARERYLIKYGSIVALIIFMYAGVWAPLSAAVDKQSKTAAQNSRLLNWFRLAVPKLQAYQRAGLNLDKISRSMQNPPSAQNIISQTESSLSNAGLTKFLTHIAQIPSANADEISDNISSIGSHITPIVKLSFKRVPFVKLQAWLSSIWNNQHIAIASVNIQKTKPTGAVNADLQLGL